MSCTGSSVTCSFVNSQATCEELLCKWMSGIGCSETTNSQCSKVLRTDYCNEYGCTWVGAPSPGSTTSGQNPNAPTPFGGLPTTAVVASTTRTTGIVGTTTSAPVADGGLIAGAVVGALFIVICLAAAIYTIIRERTRRKEENIIEMPRVEPHPPADGGPAVPVQPVLPPENPEFTRQYAASAPPPAAQPEYMRSTNVGW